jgi:hypothetical protein
MLVSIILNFTEKGYFGNIPKPEFILVSAALSDKEYHFPWMDAGPSQVMSPLIPWQWNRLNALISYRIKKIKILPGLSLSIWFRS